jgi:hypothetical protein
MWNSVDLAIVDDITWVVTTDDFKHFLRRQQLMKRLRNVVGVS